MSTASRWRTIGIIGGLGPLACAHFYRTLVTRTPAASDQDHPQVLLISDPGIPSRLQHLLFKTADPTPALRTVAARLADAGAELIVVPSVTTAAYLPAIRDEVNVPVVDTLTTLADGIVVAGARCPSVMATTGARQLGLLDSALREAGLEPNYPDAELQQLIQRVVDSVKEARIEQGRRMLEEVISGAWARDGDVVLVGCTELSPITAADGVAVLDVCALLVDATLNQARRT